MAKSKSGKWPVETEPRFPKSKGARKRVLQAQKRNAHKEANRHYNKEEVGKMIAPSVVWKKYTAKKNRALSAADTISGQIKNVKNYKASKTSQSINTVGSRSRTRKQKDR